MVALTVYYSNAASGTIGTAEQMYSTLGTPTLATALTSTGQLTGWGQIYSQGNAGAWPALGAIGSPDGHGFLFDVTTLEGQQFLAGLWTGNVRVQTIGSGAGTIVADIHERAYQRTSGGTYTLIAEMIKASLTINVATNYQPTVTTSVNSATFATGDKLYLDIWFNIASNTATTSVANIKQFSLSTDTVGKTGVANGSVATPGYQVLPPAQSLIQRRLSVGRRAL